MGINYHKKFCNTCKKETYQSKEDDKCYICRTRNDGSEEIIADWRKNLYINGNFKFKK